MYKTAVYRLVNGGITHHKQQISEKGDDAAIHRLALSVNVLPRSVQCICVRLLCMGRPLISPAILAIYKRFQAINFLSSINC